MKAKKQLSRVQQTRDTVLLAVSWQVFNACIHKTWSPNRSDPSWRRVKKTLASYARAIRQEDRDRG